jgi:6-phosphogluconolactonase
MAMSQQKEILFIGTYTETGSYGIYVAAFDINTGKISLLDSVAASNPSYLVQSPDGKKLYAIDELAGGKGGDVSAFQYDEKKHKLEFINKQSTGGDHPCFVDIHPRGKWVAAANYSGGSLSILPVMKEGDLAPVNQFFQYTGQGLNPKRQEKPHVHQSLFSPDGKYLWVTDLGLDEIKRYKFNPKKPQPVQESKVLVLGTKPGAGPRHIALYPEKNLVYVLTEMEGAISVFKTEKSNAVLLQNVACDTVSKQPGSAAIFLSPDKKFLYVSNRADANSLTIFKIDKTSGLLDRVGGHSTLGAGPRNFVLHPSGKWLLAANQRSNDIVVFQRDMQTGLLTPVSQKLSLPTPVCLIFAR